MRRIMTGNPLQIISKTAFDTLPAQTTMYVSHILSMHESLLIMSSFLDSSSLAQLYSALTTTGAPFGLNVSYCCGFGWMSNHSRISAPSGIVCNGIPLTTAVNSSCQCKQSTFNAYTSTGDPNACLDSANTTFVDGTCNPNGCPPGQRVYQTESFPSVSCQTNNPLYVNTVELYNTACQGEIVKI